MLGKVRVPWMTELLPGGLQWEVGAASYLPGGGGTALEEREGARGCFCPCAPQGTVHMRLLSPATSRPPPEHPRFVLTLPEVTLCFRDGLCLQERLPGWLAVYCSFLKSF